MSRARRVLISAALVASAPLATACDGGDSAEREATSSSSSTASTEPSTAPAWASLEGPLGRCGPQPASLGEEPFRYSTLHDPAVGSIPAVRLGHGQVVVVLLHQTNGNGLCGWLPFMPAAADAGLTVLAIDLCRYGRSDCRAVDQGTFTDAAQTAPVALALDYARTELHARRVVVVGASMGGSVALMSAATLSGIDSAVDLSGPVGWNGMDVVRRGRALKVPVLVAMATSEGSEEAAGAREIVANSPPGSLLLTPDAGHGYELLDDPDGQPLPLAADVLRWIRRHS